MGGSAAGKEVEEDGLCWDTIKEDTGRGNIGASVENIPDEDINSHYKIMPSGELNIICI